MAYDDASVRGPRSGAPDGVRFGSRRARARTDAAAADYRGGGQRESESSQPSAAYSDPGPWGSYRQDPDDRHAAYRRPGDIEPESGAGVSAPARLNDVFDDPAHGEPGRDRMAVHIGWEVVLLLGVAALVYLLRREDPAVLRSPTLDVLLLSAVALGLLALGAGLTLRAGVPNLALGPIAIAAALHYAENADRGVAVAAGHAAVVAAVGGVALALLVVGLHVPSWAGSLGAALAVIVFIQLRTGPVAVQSGGFDPTPYALYLFGGFAALAVLGGMVGSGRSVRRLVGRFRPVSDPADRRGATAALMAGGALLLSVLLAVAAGMLLAASAPGPLTPTLGLEWTGLAIGTAMLAGTSAFGRRGGVFGTLFAVVLVTLFRQYEQQENLRISLPAIAAGVVGAGLLVTRLVEAFGRPLGRAAPEWTAEPETTSPAPAIWSEQGGTESWRSTLPGQSSGESGRWGDERWGSAAR